MRVLSFTGREGRDCLLGERGKESMCTHPSAVKFKYFTCTCNGGGADLQE